MSDPSGHGPRFFLTLPAPCAYLPAREERRLFTHLDMGEAGIRQHDFLAQAGFRRTQNIAYRPACPNCTACISIRIPVEAYIPSRNQQRVLRANADLASALGPAVATADYFDLFERYIAARHAQGGMELMGKSDFTQMIEDSPIETRLVTYHAPKTCDAPPGLLAVSLVDVIDDGISMVYSFFDPAQAARSLGTFLILDHIEKTRRLGLPYLYLGYWIDHSPKMAYKARFMPQERLGPQGWTLVTD